MWRLGPGGGCERIIDRVRERFAAPFATGSICLHLSASFGVSRYPRDGATFNALLAHADAAMYTAKTRSEAEQPGAGTACPDGGSLVPRPAGGA